MRPNYDMLYNTLTNTLQKLRNTVLREIILKNCLNGLSADYIIFSILFYFSILVAENWPSGVKIYLQINE